MLDEIITDKVDDIGSDKPDPDESWDEKSWDEK